MSWEPPEWRYPELKKPLEQRPMLQRRPANVWTILAFLGFLAVLMLYLIGVCLQRGRVRSEYAQSSETAVGLFSSWAMTGLNNADNFLTSLLTVPLLGLLGLLIAAVFGLLTGRRSSRVMINVLGVLLLLMGGILIIFSMTFAATAFILVALCLFVFVNLPRTVSYLDN
jgi:hypothetical protein